MGRLARVVAVDVPHHLTQRGNDRRFILDCEADRATYLSLLRENIELYGVSVMGYCLMSNHVHLVVTPADGDGLRATFAERTGATRGPSTRGSAGRGICSKAASAQW